MAPPRNPYGPAQTNNGDVWEALVNQAGEHYATAERLRAQAGSMRNQGGVLFGEPDNSGRYHDLSAQQHIQLLYADSDRELAWGHAMSTHALNYKP